ncbi:MAG: FAD-dependent monooxygenase [Phycisphaerae bacterium]|nr:FAD-dependent monooxygenase [Phycisphaerae bacterium]
MIRVNDLTLPFDHAPDALSKAIAKRLGVSPKGLQDIKIVRQSIDARRRTSIVFVYAVDVKVGNEAKVLKACVGDAKIGPAPGMIYVLTKRAKQPRTVPVVVGSGPCGLFCALILAQQGVRPLLIERGRTVKARIRDVHRFWQQGELDPVSNVQFGEGGAGTFSDGKLVTQIKDKFNRSRKVLDELVKAGAPKEILYQARPHIGTDHLVNVVKHLREAIIALGGQVRFETRLTGLTLKDHHVTGIMVNDNEPIDTASVVLALGHSARDTFAMLHSQGIAMLAKPFSMGVRIEHPQALINQAQYGKFAGHPALGAADYKLVHHGDHGRSAYSFCMCPGGQVIGAASEPGRLVTNGMSHHARSCPNANSALLVGVTPQDFNTDDPLAGVAFQRQWEARAFAVGGGQYHAPAQCVADFLVSRPTRFMRSVEPSYQPGVTCCDLRQCLPEFVADTLREAIPAMDKKLHGFAMPDAVMTALESRSSSPVRIIRDETFQSPSVQGLYPAGEGAGYAGGIMSAAVDGIKVAEAVISDL